MGAADIARPENDGLFKVTISDPILNYGEHVFAYFSQSN